MKIKLKNITAIVLAVLICASVIISCPFALASPVEAKETASPKNRAEMTPEELIAEVAPPMPEEKEPLVKIQEAKEKIDDDIIGDVDGDSVVSVLDATTIQRWLAELPTDLKESVADTDGDGYISITDATVIQRYIAEIPTPTDYPLTPGKEETFEHTHLFNNDVTLVKPTCEKGGERVGKCACGAVQTITYYPTGHEYEADSFTAPNCEKSGTVHFKCKHCGSGLSKKIEPFGHNYKEIVTDPTCTKSGSVINRCQNKGCDDFYIVRNIDPTGHKLVHHEGKNATCTEDGYKAYDTCENCDYTNQEIIKAKGHIPAASVRENENPADNSYDEVVYCSVCHEELSRNHHVDQTQHNHTPNQAVRENEDPATCTKAGSYEEVVYCKDCGEEISRVKKTIPKSAHTAGTPVRENEKPATCKNAGSYEEVVYCSVCYTEISRTSKTISKLSHTPGEVVRENEKSATCVKTGSYDEVIYCKNCKDEISHITKTSEINPDAHTPANSVRENEIPSTCKNTGSYDEVVYCKDCGYKISSKTYTIAIDKNAHKIIHVDGIPATENSTGTKEYYKCSLCGKLFSDENGKNEISKDSLIIPKLVHEHKPAKAVREKIVGATCFSTGSYEEVVYCSDCGEELSRTRKIIDKVPHAEEPPVKENVKAATCVQKGSYDEVVYCGACNAEISRTKKEIAIDENAHTLTHVNEVSATTTKEGTQAHYKCSLCGKLFSDKDGKNKVTAADLVIPKITQVDPKTCSHHWVKYVIPYNYDDMYANHCSDIPFTNDKTRNTLGQTNMGALANHTGWAIYYCDKCHIANYDRFYTNQEFGRTQEEEEQLSLKYVNDLRESLGLKKMLTNEYTTSIAKERAKELLTDYSHDKAREGTAENIATCSGGAKRAFELWKESEGHYSNMVKNYPYANLYFGYAYAVVPAKTNAHWRLVMVQVFTKSRR